MPIPAEVAESYARKAEKARERRRRYEERTGRKRHDTNDSRTTRDRLHYQDYPFIAWDGEAPSDTGYSLFGSSEGHEVCHPQLQTEECFDLILQAKEEHPQSIFIWFGSRYDIDEICRASMPLDRQSRLKRSGSVTWHGYTLSEVENKFFTIKKNGITATLYEITGWFHMRYVSALRTYGIGSPEERELLESEKNRRSEFLWEEIDEIREYMRLELKLMPRLMDKIRQICLDAGFSPKGWYGPSALALEALKRHRVYDAMSVTPEPVNLAAQHAYAGGRFEPFRGGILGYTCSADQNSAYMAAALELPNLAQGSWRKGKEFEPGKFALYHIRYREPGKISLTKPYPLFRRLKNGNIVWHRRVTGWYWTPEAELVTGSPHATFLESWVFDEATSERPFGFVLDMYHKRDVLKRLPEDNPSRHAEKAFKWALASIYGQLARRVGWDRFRKKPPRSHQLEWAGYITSRCRAEMYKVAIAQGDYLVSIDTDSVTSMKPITVPEGPGLGQWKIEEYDEGVFFQSGVYFTKKDGEWQQGKLRGMESSRRGVPAVTPDMLIEAVRSGRSIRLQPRRRYVSTRMALNGQFGQQGAWLEKANELHFGGDGKRYHNKKMCSQTCSGDVHVFMPKPMAFTPDAFADDTSYPHPLPWKDQKDYSDKEAIESYLWVNTDSKDPDDEWIAEYIEKEKKTA